MRVSAVILLLLLFAVPSGAEDWQQYRRDEAHTGWSPVDVSPPFERVSVIPADGKYKNMQADTIVSFGDWVMVHGAMAGGIPNQAHASTRSVLEIRKSTRVPRREFPSRLSHRLLIETSTGTWPYLFAERQGHMFESGFLTFLGSSVIGRYSFDVYGIVVGRDFPKGSPDYDVWQLSWEEWHVPSVMWSRSEKRGYWGWMRGVPTQTANNRPEGYCIRADGVYFKNYFISNTVVSVGHPEKWNRKEEPPPDGTCGPAVWDLNGGPPVSEVCGQYGMLAVDKKRGRLWTARQDWRYPWEEEYDQFRGGQRRPGTSDALLAFTLPDLKLEIIKDGFSLPSTMQEPPIIGKDQVVWLAKRDDKGMLVSFDAETGNEMWATEVEPWIKIQDCSYYRQGYTTQIAASGNTIVHVGRGIRFIDARTGEIKQTFTDTGDGGYEAMYFNPVFIDGDLWVLRAYANVVSGYFVGNTPLMEEPEIPEGWVLRSYANAWFALEYDGEPPPLLRAPKIHAGFNCGGYQVEVFKAVETPPTIKVLGEVSSSTHPVFGVSME